MKLAACWRHERRIMPNKRSALIVGLLVATSAAAQVPVPFGFEDAGAAAGLTAVTTFGGKETNRYLLETTGSGVAMFDYDGDGRPDLFFVNGTTLEGFPAGKEPRPHLYRNRDGRHFEDVTTADGTERSVGMGPGGVRGRLRQRRT